MGISSKTALITGIAGQDGAYLADFLAGRGYEVHGLIRWDSFADVTEATTRLNTLRCVSDLIIHTGDITDANNVTRLIGEIQPHEIYNLAGMSQVGVSFDTPGSSFDINMSGTLNVLEAVRNLNLVAATRVYQASTSEMYGSAPAPQNEDTKMEPCSPYGVSKLAAYHLARTYRQAYGMYVSNGILFNHESPLRGEDFVTRKITRAVAQIEAGRTDALMLGNLDSIRDWGAAEDYIEGMWMMLQRPEADDFVLATGQAHSVREFVERAFAHIGVRIEWQGRGAEEVGRDAKSGRVVVAIDEALFRPAEVHYLLGDAAKARKVLGWAPKMDFDALVSQMVNADRAMLREEPKSWSMVS